MGQTFHKYQKMREKNTSFDTNIVLGGGWGNMVLNEKPTKKWKLRGLKLRGLRQNQISTLIFAHENDRRNKVYKLSGFRDETPKHICPAHAISKIEKKFQNRTPKESDQNFDIPGISVIQWMSSKFLKKKNRPHKKVMTISYPGIQPTH